MQDRIDFIFYDFIYRVIHLHRGIRGSGRAEKSKSSLKSSHRAAFPKLYLRLADDWAVDMELDSLLKSTNLVPFRGTILSTSPFLRPIDVTELEALRVISAPGFPLSSLHILKSSLSSSSFLMADLSVDPVAVPGTRITLLAKEKISRITTFVFFLTVNLAWNKYY